MTISYVRQWSRVFVGGWRKGQLMREKDDFICFIMTQDTSAKGWRKRQLHEKKQCIVLQEARVSKLG